jgi:hypothetical protein
MQSVYVCTLTQQVDLRGLVWRSPECLVSTLENKEDRDTSQISERSFVVNRKERSLTYT